MSFLLSKRGLLLSIVLMFLITAVFWVTDLDLQAAALFYHPEAANVWYEGDLPLWSFMYKMGPVISITIAVGSILLIFLSGLKAAWNGYRIQAVFVLLCFVIGPGLLVNAVFKDHWGRPRPEQVQNFGGAEQYVPPAKYNASGNGKSFPSGHSSVGFALIAFFFIWHKKRRALARLAIAVSLMMGGLLGAARMAAGGHFLSDVVWSMFIPFLVCAGLYKLYEAKLERDPEATSFSRKAGLLYSAIAFVVLSIGLFNWPVKINQNQQIAYQPYTTITVNAGHLEVELQALEAGTGTNGELGLNFYVKGFGLPGSKLLLNQQVTGDTLTLTVDEQGLLTEVEGKLRIQAPAEVLTRIQLISIVN